MKRRSSGEVSLRCGNALYVSDVPCALRCTELARLLSTAKDKDRQDLILKAMHALDEQEKTNEVNLKALSFHAMSPSLQASLLMGENVRYPVHVVVRQTLILSGPYGCVVDAGGGVDDNDPRRVSQDAAHECSTAALCA
jgi:hypothetical protein